MSQVANVLRARAWWIPVALAFLLVSLSRIDDGGTNARARFATLRAMSDDHTFRIDRYVDWTEDWAQTPDGHYYANKAPGPTLIAFPVFWAIDRALYETQSRYPDEQGRRQAPRGVHKVAVSTLFQVLPFLALSLLALAAAMPAEAGGAAWFTAAVAILFGNTSAALMSSYMGNPFAAMAMMGLAYAYLRGNVAGVAFAFGWALLADYPVAALLLPLAILLWPELRAQGAARVGRSVALGALPPAALWCWYHTACFGSPFAMPFQFHVAALAGTVNGSAGLWGKTSLIPNPEWLYELIAGPSRGLLYTQPWLLLCAVLPFAWRIPETRVRRLFRFAVFSLALLLCENAGFPGWHGGGSPGPRYLGAVLPLFGLFIPHLFLRGPAWVRAALGGTVLVSLALRALIYATWILPPVEPLWPYYVRAIQSPKEYVLLAAFAAIFGACGALAFWLDRHRLAAAAPTRAA